MAVAECASPRCRPSSVDATQDTLPSTSSDAQAASQQQQVLSAMLLAPYSLLFASFLRFFDSAISTVEQHRLFESASRCCTNGHHRAVYALINSALGSLGRHGVELDNFRVSCSGVVDVVITSDFVSPDDVFRELWVR